MTDELIKVLEDAGFEAKRMDKSSERDGAIWECKIGVKPGTSVSLPGGADLPMREAVEEAFFKLTGQYPDFIFSGWGAELSEGEKAVVDDD